MQIRVANKQDEPTLRAIAGQSRLERGLSDLDLNGEDADLTDIERHYFWHDGLFVVAEDEGKIVGLAAARRGESPDILELVRLIVIPSCRNSQAARSLLDLVQFFACNADYDFISVYPDSLGEGLPDLLEGFQLDQSNNRRQFKKIAHDR